MVFAEMGFFMQGFVSIGIFIGLASFVWRRLSNKIDDDGSVRSAARQAAKDAAKRGIVHVAGKLFKK